MWTAPSRKDVAAATGLVDCSHMSGLFHAVGRPLAQMGYADRVPNIPVMSKHQWVPRVVPILGSTDYHLALAPQHRLLVLVNRMNLKDLFGRIQPDPDNRRSDGSSWLRCHNITAWHIRCRRGPSTPTSLHCSELTKQSQYLTHR